jgi:hypothetical protein
MIGLCAAKKPLQKYVDEASNDPMHPMNLILGESVDTHAYVLRALLDYGVSPLSCVRGTPLIYLAWERGNLSNVKLLLRRGVGKLDPKCADYKKCARSRLEILSCIEKFIAIKKKYRAAAIAIAGIKSKCFLYMNGNGDVNPSSISVLPRDIIIVIAKMVWESRLEDL